MPKRSGQGYVYRPTYQEKKNGELTGKLKQSAIWMIGYSIGGRVSNSPAAWSERGARMIAKDRSPVERDEHHRMHSLDTWEVWVAT